MLRFPKAPAVVATKTVTDENGKPDVARTHHLIRRGNRWQYNRAYPKDVWPTLGSAPFRRSLRTDSLAEAQRARPEVEREYWRAIDQARAAQANKALAAELTNAAAQSLAAEAFRRWLSEGEEFTSTYASPEALDRGLEDAEEGIARARERLATGDLGRLPNTARQLAEAAGYDPSDSRGMTCLLRLLARAEVAYAEVYRGRLAGDYSVRPSDPFFASALSAPLSEPIAPSLTRAAESAPAAPQRTLADLEAAYRADKWDGLSPSAQQAYTPVFRLVRDVLGADRALSSLQREDGRRLFDTVKRLPTMLGKRAELKDLSVPAAVEAADRLNLPRLNPKTVNDTYMGNLSAMFAWGVRERWLEANPVAGLRVVEGVTAKSKRDPFTVDQLQTIFTSAPWRPEERSPGGQPMRFWGPLIALFQGMRRGEIAQLQTADLGEVEGIPVLHVRGERLKTKNAIRTLPIHPELIRLGLLDYAQSRHRLGADMLFPDLAPNSRGQWGDEVGDWFSRLIQQHGLEGARLGLHSFRHNFEDALRRAGLHGTPLGAELAGRAKGKGDPVASAYGSGFPMADLHAAVQRISYPGLTAIAEIGRG